LAEQLLMRARDRDPGKYSFGLGKFYALRAMNDASPEDRLAFQKKAFALEEQGLEMTSVAPQVLADLASLALDVGATKKAGTYAQQLLEKSSAIEDPKMRAQWSHKGNILVGRVELRNGNLTSAKEHLLAAGRVNGGATLSSFGPNMSLAKELLEKGERDVEQAEADDPAVLLRDIYHRRRRPLWAGSQQER